MVRDASGRAVPGAVVVLRPASGAERQTATGADGRFTIACRRAARRVLIVRAGGFAESRQTLSVGHGARPIDVVLAPAGVSETVTVTATRSEQRTGDVPASVSVLGREEIRQSPAVVADDVLRQVPTFSLFRRTSSLSSHPTAQGVSLRGIGPSGVSRTLVLLDGVPFNDPFGGWVYWTRVPLESVDRIEVVDGIELEPVRQLRDGRRHQHRDRAGRRAARSRSSRSTATATARRSISSRSDVWGKVGVAVDGSAFDTDGFPIVAPSERGPIDNNADVEFRNVNVEARLQPDRSRAGRSSAPATSARTATTARRARSTDRGSERHDVDDGQRRRRASGCRTRATCRRRVFGDIETFHSNFLAVPAADAAAQHRPDDAESDACRPTASAAMVAVVARRSARNQFFSAGTDWRWVDGDSQEDGARRRTTGARRSTLRSASPAARSAASARSCRTSVTPTAEADGHAQRARRSAGATTTATTSRRPSPTGHADAPTTAPSLPGSRRHGRQPARRGAAITSPIASASGAISARASARRRSTSCTASSASARC